MCNSAISKILPLLFITIFFFEAINAQKPRARERSEEVNSTDFGRERSIGISTLGTGIIGVNTRFITESESQWEIELMYSPLLNSDEPFNINEWRHGVSLIGGYNIITGRNDKWYKEKLVKNYVSIKAGYWYINKQRNILIGPTWHREAFKYRSKNKSFGLDLGLLYAFEHYEGTNIGANGFLPFIRLDWNFFRAK